MEILQNISLKPYNTFGLDTKANQFVQVHSLEDLQEALKLPHPNLYLLGGGSNLLLKQDLPGLVIQFEILGKSIARQEDNDVYVEAGAGENWHEFVLWSLDQGLNGLENLSLIPGRVGASPIQNIGAYGVELKDVFHELEAVELDTGAVRIFKHADCKFGYRDSVFKRSLKGKYAITKVTFKLSRAPQVNTSYGAIQQCLTEQGIQQPTAKDVSEAVIAIRSSKLPDPAVLGNSGSFFKNPEIPKAQFERLQTAFPHIVSYPLPHDNVKVPAGWLIEQCGWKGKRVGNTGCYEKQALVLVNYGDATGEEIYAHAQRVMESVNQKFGIQLVPEVNIW